METDYWARIVGNDDQLIGVAGTWITATSKSNPSVRLVSFPLMELKGDIARRAPHRRVIDIFPAGSRLVCNDHTYGIVLLHGQVKITPDKVIVVDAAGVLLPENLAFIDFRQPHNIKLISESARLALKVYDEGAG